jgi:hypothetical protein
MFYLNNNKMSTSEMIELSELDLDSSFDKTTNNLKSTNFGSGIELLMNDKIKEGEKKKHRYKC